MTQEDYVTFEQAKALKEKGFPQMGLESYHYDEETKTVYNEQIYRPTISLVQKWLREEKNLFVDIASLTDIGPIKFGFIISTKGNIGGANPSQKIWYDTYEEALLEAIDKALKLI